MTEPDRDTSALSDDAFTAHTLDRIDAAARETRDATLREALIVARHPRPPRWHLPAVALAAAAIAAVVTFALTRPATTDVAAFDGGLSTTRLAEHALSRDARGRLSEITTTLPDGSQEHLSFRSGRLVRVEQRRAGALDGPALDFDAFGRLVAIRWFAMGKDSGPWFTFTPSGALDASGSTAAP